MHHYTAAAKVIVFIIQMKIIFFSRHWGKSRQKDYIAVRQSRVSRSVHGPHGPRYTPRYDSAVIFEGFQGTVFEAPWWWETSASQTAVFIPVEIPDWFSSLKYFLQISQLEKCFDLNSTLIVPTILYFISEHNGITFCTKIRGKLSVIFHSVWNWRRQFTSWDSFPCIFLLFLK